MTELKKVRHTSVYCEVEAGLPEELTEPKTERKEGSVASVRLDAVLSLAFSSSRSKMVPLIEGGQVFINGKLVTSPSASLKEDDLVTVRHMGKIPLCWRAESDGKREGCTWLLNDLSHNRYFEGFYRKRPLTVFVKRRYYRGYVEGPQL